MNIELNAGNGSFDAAKEKLVSDLKLVMVDADTLLKEVASSTTEEIVSTRRRIEARLAEARSRLADTGAAVTARTRATVEATDGYIRENPWKSLGIAAGAGLIIGFLLNRN